MRIAAVTPAYNEKVLMRGCIESLRGLVDTHVVLVSERPYFGQADKDDGTADLASELGALVLKGVWEMDHHQRNTGIKLLKDYDWIITTDVDMWMTKAQQEILRKTLKETSAEALVTPQISYWKDINHQIVDDGFMPVIAIRPHVRFVHIGNVGCPWKPLHVPVIHHLAWCEPKDIYKKVITYPHAPEFNGHKWYEKNYKSWQESNYADLPDRRYKISKVDFPEELKAYL